MVGRLCAWLTVPVHAVLVLDPVMIATLPTMPRWSGVTNLSVLVLAAASASLARYSLKYSSTSSSLASVSTNPAKVRTTRSVLAAVHSKMTRSYCVVDCMYPPVPVVVATPQNLISCDAFCAIFRPPAHFHMTATLSQTAAVVGNVKVTRLALLAMYHSQLVMDFVVPVISLHTIFAPIGHPNTSILWWVIDVIPDPSHTTAASLA